MRSLIQRKWRQSNCWAKYALMAFWPNQHRTLRVLLVMYLISLSIAGTSLSVPPADLPICEWMFILSSFGLYLARRETRAWRVIWTSALIASVLCGALEVIAGQLIAHHRSKSDSRIGLTMPGSSEAKLHRP
jgi:hypothetical protein